MEISMKKKIMVILFSIITVIFLNINLEVVQEFRDCLNSFEIKNIILFILIYMLFINNMYIEDKRAKICCSILAIIFRTL